MVRPSTGQIRSRDSETPCGASRSARTPRRRPRKMAGNGGFGVYFEHLSTGVNGVGKCDFRVRNSHLQSPSWLIPAPSKSGQMTSEMPRFHPSSFRLHPSAHQERSDDPRDVAAPAVQRFLLTSQLNYTSWSQLRFACAAEVSTDVCTSERLTRRIFPQMAQRSTSTRANHNPRSS
jgi:hypothetical protein